MVDTFSPSERSRIMAAVKAKDTTPEMVVRRIAHALGFRFRLHIKGLPGTPDLVFPRLKRVIIVNGCFWHGHTCGRCRIPATRREYWVAKINRNMERDRSSRRALRRGGWRVMVVWECQTIVRRQSEFKRRLTRFLTD